jgi:hypothetical protein
VLAPALGERRLLMLGLTMSVLEQALLAMAATKWQVWRARQWGRAPGAAAPPAAEASRPSGSTLITTPPCRAGPRRAMRPYLMPHTTTPRPPTAAAQALAAIAVGSVGGVGFPAISAIKANCCGDDAQGLVQGALAGIRSLATGLGPVGFAALFTATTTTGGALAGRPGLTFWAAAVLTAAALAVAATVRLPTGGGGGGEGEGGAGAAAFLEGATSDEVVVRVRPAVGGAWVAGARDDDDAVVHDQEAQRGAAPARRKAAPEARASRGRARNGPGAGAEQRWPLLGPGEEAGADV